MKKKLSILLILVLVFALFATACGDKESGNESQKTEYMDLPYAGLDLAQYVQLPDYYAFDDIKKVKVEVTEADYEEGYRQFAAQFNGTVEATTGVVEAGDTITISFEGTLEDGTKPSGMQSSSYQYTVGIGSMISGFDDAVIGSNVGETVTANCTFPDPYPNGPELAGKKATFVIGIKSKSVAAEYTGLTEEMLAQTNFDSLDELKQAIREAVLDNANQDALTTVKQEIIQKILDGVKVENYPEEKVSAKADLIDNFNKVYAQLQGIDWESFRDTQFSSEEEYQNSLVESAKNSIMQDMAMNAIAQKEEIKIEKAEYDQYKTYYMQSIGTDSEQGFADYLGGITIDEYLEYLGIVNGLIADKIADKVYEKCAK